jgi:putative transposase
MLRSKKYRLYPSESQILELEKHFGCCRLIWNLALAVKIESWKGAKKNISRYDLQKQLVDLKSEYSWLYEVNAQSLQSVLLHLDNAFKGFFNGNGYPKFKKKSGHQSFHCPQRVRLEEGKIRLPLLKSIRCEGAQPVVGQIKTVTISRTPTGKYFASVLVDDKKELPAKPSVNPETTVGIDVGIKSFVVTSNGRSYEPNRYLKNSLQRLKCLQRRASRKKKGSQNRKRANLCVAILHEKITNQRADYVHKITTGLIRDNQAETFVIEDLNVVGMLKNRKLSQGIADVSFGEFVRQMKYKCKWYGKNLIQIGRFQPSSKTCSSCGYIKEDLTLADREWTCASCGSTHDRDENAAINIRKMGLEKHSGEGISDEPVESRRLRRAKKQEKYLVETNI